MTRFRRLQSFFVMMLTASMAWAYDIPTSGTCGTNTSYVITGSENNYTLTISGTGVIDNSFFYGISGKKDLSGIKTVIINEGITGIGNDAFNNAYNRQDNRAQHEFTSVSIPSTVTSIGNDAFRECRSLQTVTIATGSQLTSIGDRAFNNTILNQITLPCPSLASIGTSVFNLYETGKTLSEVICLTETNLSVHGYVFYNCSNMATVYMLGDHRVNWPNAKAMKSLVKEVVAGSGISSLSVDYSLAEKKSAAGVDYYVGGSTVGLTLSTSLTGDVVYLANGQVMNVTNGTATLTLPEDASTVTITAQNVQTLAHGSGTEQDPYQISSLDDWNTFVGMINMGYKADKHYELTTNIGTAQAPVTTMAGTANTPFRGTFHGRNHTLTIGYGTNSEYLSADNAAPFLYINGAVIEKLTVNGTIYTSKKCAAGIAAHSYGDCYIIECASNVAINSSVDGDGTHGGFVGVNESGACLYFSNCVFSGSMAGSTTHSCGGFVGYNSGTRIEYADCLQNGTFTISTTNCCTFNRNGKYNAQRTYYLTTLGTVQGRQASASPFSTFCKKKTQFGTEYYVGGEVSITVSPYYTTGSVINVTPTVRFDGTTLTTDDYDQTSDPAVIQDAGVYTLIITGKGSYAGTTSTTVDVVTRLSGGGTEQSPYLISTADDWNMFTRLVNTGADQFISNYVKLADDWNDDTPITTMVGTSSHMFRGNFDGNGHTLTLNNLSATSEFCAPFRYVNGASIYNLHTTGTVIAGSNGTNDKYRSGLVGQANGTTTISNCWSSVNITSELSGDGTHGGFVGVTNNGSTTISNCRFDGSITGSTTTCCGGFVGWRNSTLNISNCLYAPTLPTGKYTVGTEGSATFTRNNDNSVSDSYYTETLGEAQGTDASSMTASELLAGLGSSWIIIDGKVIPKMWDAVLADDGDNGSLISAAANIIVGKSALLYNRTLYKDGKWNTLVLPFDVTIADSPLAGAVARTVTAASITGTTLNITFGNPVTTLQAGTPYIIKWEKAADYDTADPATRDINNPLFRGRQFTNNYVEFDNGGSGDNWIQFTPVYHTVTFTDNTNALLMGDNNKLRYPKSGAKLGAQRAYFLIHNGQFSSSARQLTSFNLNFEDGETTGVQSLSSALSEGEPAVYNLQGQRVNAQRKGLYIKNGKKIIVK